MSGIEKLGPFLREVCNWGWDEFVKAEKDTSYTSNQAIIFQLIRSCSMQKLDAIKLALNRIDGKLKTPLRVEYPKFYYLYPNAKLPESDPNLKIGYDVGKDGGDHTAIATMVDGEVKSVEVYEPPKVEAEPEDENDLPSLSLRETLSKMADYPRELPEQVVEYSLQTEQWLRNQGDAPDEIPKVKSIVAANLLIMAQNRNLNAITEVFDQIDGKLAETIQIMGDDIHIIKYSTEAPPGAYLNKDGIVEVQALNTENQWAAKLGRELIE
jgi:hypothetical protein